MNLPPIHCDLGEGENREHTRALMSLVDCANIACGGHAGDERTMAFCLELAAANGVQAGAHPGFPDRKTFGRSSPVAIDPADLIELLDTQMESFLSVARGLGVTVTHLKLHGALYHQVDRDPVLGQAYLGHVVRRWPNLAVIARAGGGLTALAKASSARIRWEAFLDRGYCADGTLVPRGNPGAVLDDPEAVMGRVRSLLERGGWRSTDDSWISLDPDSLCVHGDSPMAIAMLTRLRTVHPRFTADGRSVE